ncbi:MAG: putative inosine triphosphate pyrophosphatase [Candidatus Saccharibacteria bacterium]|nr:putative inosine triphosphate pyrophosphatase [Candidatus Saccharibacteria bacterium]
MQQPAFTIVTGNAGKLASFTRHFKGVLVFDSADVDLEEIQSLDSDAIVRDKAERAYAVVGKPVLVEDVSAGLDRLQGLPGPFIKFFELQLGMDALYQLSQPGDKAIVTCTIGLYDGQSMRYAHGKVEGTAVSPRGENGFGFDCCFMPEGQTKTYAEMTHTEKDAISHRALAVADLLTQLQEL